MFFRKTRGLGGATSAWVDAANKSMSSPATGIEPAYPAWDKLTVLHELPRQAPTCGTPTPRSWVARMTKRLALTGVGKSASIPGAPKSGRTYGQIRCETQ